MHSDSVIEVSLGLISGSLILLVHRALVTSVGRLADVVAIDLGKRFAGGEVEPLAVELTDRTGPGLVARARRSERGISREWIKRLARECVGLSLVGDDEIEQRAILREEAIRRVVHLAETIGIEEAQKLIRRDFR